VYQSTPKISPVNPALNAAAAIQGTGKGSISASGSSANEKQQSVAMNIGRAKWTRRTTSPPAMFPKPFAAAITPQAAAPPSARLATTGPTTP
jgi:hypothetical protein